MFSVEALQAPTGRRRTAHPGRRPPATATACPAQRAAASLAGLSASCLARWEISLRSDHDWEWRHTRRPARPGPTKPRALGCAMMGAGRRPSLHPPLHPCSCSMPNQTRRDADAHPGRPAPTSSHRRWSVCGSHAIPRDQGHATHQAPTRTCTSAMMNSTPSSPSMPFAASATCRHP